ncbi:SRPBCC family protein [Actinocorallia longicatena]|uniref:Carbon monoxide dehydrogenase subunit G n=1 Tax=Actinocorallia longicatena TaxID=111803 RepID=A0ABP6QIR8_9ACTN
MELDHEFTVQADPAAVWRALQDPGLVAPLIPGAVLKPAEKADDDLAGKLKLKFGPTSVTLKGSAHVLVTDDLTRTAIVEAHAREARGPGTATATFQATVHTAPGASRVTLHTKLTLTGRIAAFSEPLVHDTGAKLLTKFATALTAALNAPEPETVAATAPVAEAVAELEDELRTEPEPVVEAEPEAVVVAEPEVVKAEEPDWFAAVERPSLVRRLAPFAGLLLVFLLIRRMMRAKRPA